MGTATLLAALVAALAVLVGVVSVARPQLFLRIPHYGYIPWALTGHMLPPSITHDPFLGSEHHSWLRDGDLVVAVAAKSGTTWMCYCSHQIRTKGSDRHEWGDVSYTTPWMEKLQHPDHTWADEKELYNTTILANGKSLKEYWDHPDFPFRIFKSHLFPREAAGGVLPVRQRPDVKFLAMVRNHLDQFASLIPFIDQHTEEHRAMWGGFPPRSSGDEKKDSAEWLRMLSAGGIFSKIAFPYTLGWWAARHEKNVLLLHFADVLRDLRGAVLKLAAFLGVALSESELERVVHRCSIEHMRTVPNGGFLYMQPLSGVPGLHAINDSKAMIRRGKTGDGKTMLNDEQKAAWTKQEEEAYGHDPALLRWVREGGPWGE